MPDQFVQYFICFIAMVLLSLSLPLYTHPQVPYPILLIYSYSYYFIFLQKIIIIINKNTTQIKMSEGVDSKKAQFKNYLQKTGAVDQLTKVLVQLYEQNQRPQKSVDYIRRFLGASGDMDGEKLQKEYDDAIAENQKLKKQIAEVKEQIQKRRK